MLIEAAKGGHTNVVSVLIDYNPTTLTGSGPAEVVPAPATQALPAEDQQQQAVVQADTTTTTTTITTGDQPITTRFPAEGHEGQDQAAVAAAVTSSSQTPSSTTASAASAAAAAAAAAAATSMPNKSK